MQRLEQINRQHQNEFFYTQKGDFLTKEQRQFYEENGYLVIKGLLKPTEYGKYVERFLEYCDQKRPPYPGMAMVRDISLLKSGKKKTGEAAVTKIQDWQDDDVLFDYCKHPDVVKVVQDIIGPNVNSIHTMLINKPPNTGATQRHPLHQDLAYFPMRPAERIVCAWSSMEKVTRENGGLVIYPGTHKMPFVEHGYPDWKEGVNKGYWGILDKYMPSKEAVKIHPDMDAGDVVFFHPHILHGSGQNRTQRFRKSISCHYCASEVQFIDVKGTNNENVANGVLDFAKSKYKMDVSYNDIWKLKSRLISGKGFDECSKTEN